MRGVGHGRDRDQQEPDSPGDQQESESRVDQSVAHWEAHTARGGYLGDAYPASPPPAEAPASGPDPQSADPDYQRPEYPTDPGGIAVPGSDGDDAEHASADPAGD